MASTTTTQVCRYFAMLLFAALSVQGFWGGFQQLDQNQTAGQAAQTATQWVFGILSGAITVLLIRRRLVWPGLGWLWGASVTAAGGLAPVVWGGASISAGIWSALACAAIAAAMLWLARLGLRQEG